MRAIFAVPVEHYFDDFILPDLAAAGDSGTEALQELILMLGSGSVGPPSKPARALELDLGKTKPASSANVVLGVVANLSALQETPPCVRFQADPARVERVLAEFRGAFEKGQLSPHLASQLRGKLFFIVSAAYGMVGRAATLPLVQRPRRSPAGVSRGFRAALGPPLL